MMLLLMGPMILFSCKKDNDDDEQPMPAQNAVEFLASNPDYSLLHEAIVVAGLDGTLSGTGPFTLFAPDDNAIQTLMNALSVSSLSEVDVDLLKSILLYHVLGEEIPASSVSTGYKATLSPSSQAGNPKLALYLNADGGVSVNKVDVTEADMEVSNGVIHGIDQVLTLPDLPTFLTYDDHFGLLGEALAVADDEDDDTDNFMDILMGDGPFTVFAPNDDAFQALLDSNDDWSSLEDIDDELLETVLLYHVVAGNIRSNELTDGMELTTLSGATLMVDASGTNPVLIDGAGRTISLGAIDVQATNGVAHGVDMVLLPE